MTTDIIELSKQAAEVLGIAPFTSLYDVGGNWELLDEICDVIWLAEDSGRCAEIAADKRISIDFSDPHYPSASFKAFKGGIGYTVELVEDTADHNNNRKQAWRVAVLKAVIEQGKQ